MWHLMSREGPEIAIGDSTHTLQGEHRCKVLAVNQRTGRVKVQFEADRTIAEYEPSTFGCYLLSQDHPCSPAESPRKPARSAATS